jgi:hypothetical protein
MARRISIWERLRESTEGPTVSLQIPREWAEELLRSLASALEVEDMGSDDGMGMDDMGGMDVPHMEPDADDLGGPPDFDSDDAGMDAMSPDEKSDSESDDDDDDESDEDEDDEDEDEDEEQDEAAGPVRPRTALGERYARFKGRPTGKPAKAPARPVRRK